MSRDTESTQGKTVATSRDYFKVLQRLVAVGLFASVAWGCGGESTHRSADQNSSDENSANAENSANGQNSTNSENSSTNSVNASNNTNAVNNTNGANNANSTNNTNNTNGGNNTNNVIVGEPTVVVGVQNVSTDHVATSLACVDCHANDGVTPAMVDSAGREIGPFDLWQSSMKANSARDPFFLAVLSAEQYRNPELADAIDDVCMKCHTPMAVIDADLEGDSIAISDVGEEDTRGHLGADGVSCVVCHAITDDEFGDDDSFSGGYTFSTSGELYGPHADPFARPMENNTGFTPTQGQHTMESAMCATCHTLFTETIDNGEIVEDSHFPEQTPYLEWRNSVFNDEVANPAPQAASCQDCHMPTVDEDGNLISTYIARRPGTGTFGSTSPRQPYGRHLLVGGNTLIPEIFKTYRDVLNPMAPDAAFDATIAATRDQLRNRTATVSVSNSSEVNGTVAFDVTIQAMTGHKFPSAYPSRRAWLHVMVKDAAGTVLAESGAYDSAGFILGADGARLAAETPGTAVEQHHQTITSGDQAQIYESVLGTTVGEPTVALLYAAKYAKDNRILPMGWSSTHPDAEYTTPVGVDGDSDFVGGADTVRYELPVTGSAALIEVELVYQTLGARWAADLFQVPTADVQRFRGMVDGVGGLTPELVARATSAL